MEPLMNHAYRIVKNAATGLWQAVPETARANGKCGGGGNFLYSNGFL